MLTFDIITIFPHIFDYYFNESIIKRAKNKKLIQINIYNLRNFAVGKHKIVDDKSYGGGPGMVFKIEPLIKTISSILKINSKSRISNSKSQIPNSKQIPKSKILKHKTLVIITSAVGKQFDSKIAANWAKKYNHLILIAGHYEGIDERIKKVVKDQGFKIQEVSVGPYVLTGGELPIMVILDAVSRHIPGVLGKKESLEEKRYGIGVPVYTRPEVFKYRSKKYKVPKVLLSGNHKKIDEWRKKHQKRK